MSRTTLFLEKGLLKEIEKLRYRERKTKKKLITELLTLGLETKRRPRAATIHEIKWHSQPMGAKVDYSDKDDLYKALDKG